MVKFIVDSTFGLSKVFAEEHDVKVVSLTLTLEDKEYIEGYKEDWDAFYGAYTMCKASAKTSQPSPKLFEQAIDAIYAKDPDSDIIILTIADRLSGTIGSAQIATMQYPERNIIAIDTFNVAVAAKLFLEEMIKAADAGTDYKGLLELAEDLKQRLATRFIPATLNELARGGRVSKLVSTIGTILKIKPVFQFARNEVKIPAKSIGTKLAISAAINLLPKKFDRLKICYIYDDKLVDTLRDKLEKTFGLEQIEVESVSPVLGAHVGVGTVGIITLASKDCGTY